MVFLFICVFTTDSTAQKISLFDYIKKQSDINSGGCNVYTLKDTAYIVCVSQVVVGTKNESSCRSIGFAKAKRDIIAFVNGSEINSSTEIRTSEIYEEGVTGLKRLLKQEYVETIKEDVVATINQCVPLGGWYSDDKSLYYFAIYKTIKS